MAPNKTISLFRLFGIFLNALEEYKSKYLTVYAFSYVHSICGPVSVFLSTLAINFLARGQFDEITPFFMFVGGILLTDFISLIALCIYSPLIAKYGRIAQNNIIKHSLEHIKDLDLGWYAQMNGGDLIHRITRGAEALLKVIAVTANLMFHETVRIILICGFTLYLLQDVRFFLGVLVYVIASVLILKRYSPAIMARNREFFESERDSFVSVFNFSSGFSTIKMANQAGYFIQRMKDSLENLPGKQFEISQLTNWRRMWMRLVRFLLYFGLFIFVGFMIMDGQAEVGALVLVFSLLQNTEKWLQDFSMAEEEFLKNKAYFESLQDVFDVKPAITDYKDAQDIPTTWQVIKARDLSFTYETGKETALNGVSLDIEKGKSYGFVGLSGSGKSTMMKLILKQYLPSGGKLAFDDLSYDHIRMESLYNTIMYLPQDVEIFDLSFKENITLGLDGRDIDNLKDIAHLDDILNRLSEGWDTMVGSRGIRLSGGERQRLGIARALHLEKDIYLFDECTSQLDSYTEAKVLDNVEKHLQGKTRIYVAHRLYTVQHCDKIFVFDKGQIVEQGTHEQLIAGKSHYAKLWQMQSGGFL